MWWADHFINQKHYGVDSHLTIISVDEVTIVELRNITASTISRQQFFYDELTITATRNITESTITAKKNYCKAEKSNNNYQVDND